MKAPGSLNKCSQFTTEPGNVSSSSLKDKMDEISQLVQTELISSNKIAVVVVYLCAITQEVSAVRLIIPGVTCS